MDDLTEADEATLLARRVENTERITLHAAVMDGLRTEIAQIDGELALRGLVGSGDAGALLESELSEGGAS